MKTSALTKWLVGAVTAALLALGGWAGQSIITNGNAITRVEADQRADRDFLRDRLDRIEDKVDRIDNFLRRHAQ